MMRMPSKNSGQARRLKEVTGQTVLLCLLAFFVTVASVNAVLIRAAVSTFGGLETESSYRAGLAFAREVAASEAQQARHWQVHARVSPVVHGQVRIELSALDAEKRPLTGYTATALLAHPTDRRLDRAISLQPSGAGHFKGIAATAPGQWDLVIELAQSGERLFRSRERITLKAGEAQ